MSQIVIERGEGSLADRFRPYKVIINGEYRGSIRQREKWAFAVPPGVHTVHLRIDLYCSPPIRVAVVNRTRLVCKSSVAHALGLLAVFSPSSWITVREEDDASELELLEAQYPQRAQPPVKPRPRGGIFRRRSGQRAAAAAREPAYRLAGAKTDEPTQARRLLELDLRDAVASNALEVQYEPQMDLATQRVVAFEALLRWRHPVRGVVPPSVFVPVAEELGLIGAISKSVLEQACAEAAAWPHDICVSVNLSDRQFTDAALPAIVAAALDAAGLQSARLELEVAEATVMEQSAQTAATCRALRDAGVRISVDGFGVGYAALSYVPDTVFDKLKISRAVVRDLGDPDDRIQVVRAAARLGASLGMTTCAVGVETQEQLAILVSEGCTQAQGRVFGPPLTAREVPGFIARINNGDAGAVTLPGPGALSFFQVVESVNDSVVVTTAQIDAPGPVILYVNPAFTRLTGYKPAEVIGLTPRILQGPGTSRATLDRIRKGLSEGRTVREKILNFSKNGAPYWIELRIVPLRAADGTITHFTAIQRDITMDKRREDDLEILADRDILTGIPNGRALLRSVDAEIAAAKAAGTAGTHGPCVAFLAVTDFNVLADQRADAVLQAVADRLADNVRRCDTLCRISAEIFGLCMPTVTRRDAHAIVDALCRAVSATPIDTPAGPVSTGLCASVVAFDGDDGAAALIQRADAAMTAARQAAVPRSVPAAA
jgi:PAS domain S-box-containing protein/diguanylate cyclase (GGDEF)-like protein